jgi:cell division protease FtsH
MSDKLGPLSFGKRDELVFLGREIGEQRNYSDDIAKQIDEEIRAIIDRAYERAMDVLVEHRERLDNLAKKLIAEETVDSVEFEKLFSDLPPKETLHGLPPRPKGGAPATPLPDAEAAASGPKGTTSPAPNPA